MSYNQIPAGKDVPNDIYVVIEIPANHAPIKYEIDKDADALFVDRFVGTAMFYPANYGYIPNTLSEDGDALDVLVVTPYPVVPGAVIRCRPVGKLKMEDEAGMDAKLIAVPHDKLTPLYKHVKEYTDLPELLLKQIEHFFAHYKDLEPGKWVKITGWEGSDVAKEEILKSIDCKVSEVENLGQREFSRAVDRKFLSGLYVQIKFEGPVTAPAAFAEKLHLDRTVDRIMVQSVK